MGAYWRRGLKIGGGGGELIRLTAMDMGAYWEGGGGGGGGRGGTKKRVGALIRGNSVYNIKHFFLL